MFSTRSVLASYKRNLDQIRQLTDGMTHAQSLAQPPADWNCANWIVGHIACYRNLILSVLDQPPALDPDIAKRYPFGSPPVKGEEPGIGQFDDLLRAIGDAQAGIERGLNALGAEQLSEIIQTTFGPMPRDERLVMLLRHEAYHTGQLEFLRAFVAVAV